MRRFRNCVDRVLGIAAVVIAVAALITSVLQGFAQRKHDRLSLRPALRLDKIVSEEDKLMGIHLRNAGTGPALVTRFTVNVDGQPVAKGPVDVWENAEKALGLFGRKLPLTEFYYDRDDSIPIDETKYIIGVDDAAYEKLSDSDKDLVSGAIKRIRIEIEYTSVYEDPFKVQYPH